MGCRICIHGKTTHNRRVCSKCLYRQKKAWRANNIDRVRQYGRNWYRKNKDKVREKNKRYRRQSPSKINYLKLRNALGKYGLSIKDFEQMNTKQGGLCAICGLGPRGIHKRLCVDHCHKSGKVRDLLCGVCNMVLGYVESYGVSPARLQEYLEKHNVP